jgi:hypothetical protein
MISPVHTKKMTTAEDASQTQTNVIPLRVALLRHQPFLIMPRLWLKM